jgi:hypothetical protein
MFNTVTRCGNNYKLRSKHTEEFGDNLSATQTSPGGGGGEICCAFFWYVFHSSDRRQYSAFLLQDLF